MEPLISLNAVAFSLAIPALIAGGLAAYAFTRRPVVGSRVFAFLMLALCVWSVFYGVELSCLTLDGMLACAAVEYLGIATLPVLWLILTLLYTGRGKWLTRRNIILLFVVPSITIVMVATARLHHFYYSTAGVDTSGPFPELELTRGPWFWVHTVYSYSALLIITFILIKQLGKPNTVFRNQVTAMLVGMSVPWAVSILYVGFGLMLFGHVDPTPFAFTITGMVIGWSIFRHGLFDILPVAYDTIVDSMANAIVVIDMQNRMVAYNRSAGKIFSLSGSAIGQPAAVIWKGRPGLMDLTQSEGSAQIEMELDVNGSGAFYEASAYSLTDRHQHVIGRVISLHDITDKKLAEETLRESEEKFRLLVENANDMVWTLDNDMKITYVSPAVRKLLGYETEMLTGRAIGEIMKPEVLQSAVQTVDVNKPAIEAGTDGSIRLERKWYRKDGSSIWVETVARALYDHDGRHTGYIGVTRDISERKQLQQKLEEMATHDYLTALPNRVLLSDRFTIAAALAQRNKARLAVMSLDLDKFKSINDTLGHGAGDAVLRSVSTRLKGIIRGSDTLARVGGDEFILLMMETSDIKDTAATAQKILDSFTQPFAIDGHRLHLSTSVGIASYPEDAGDLETLIKKSDAAMYYAKGHGRNRFKFFSDGDVRISGDHKSGPRA